MKDEIHVGQSLKSEQHANCLIRCMNCIDYLKNDISNMSMFPRFVQEDFRFLDVQFEGESLKKYLFQCYAFVIFRLKI